jgi:hypothetical protein
LLRRAAKRKIFNAGNSAVPDDPRRFLVHEEQVNGPATHAIVIGVGDYPHLLDGSRAVSQFNDGMGQLTSPPESARGMACWLIEEFHNPDAPLATVALLLSDSTSKEFKNPRTQDRFQLERAEMPAVKEAVKNWKRRGDSLAGNLLLFFFCGHGVAQGPDSSLLLSDYGADDDNPLAGAVDFTTLRLGMKRCTAARQLYFVDACRSSSDTLIESLDERGDPIILPLQSELKDTESPVFYSTLAGAKAFGRTGKPSAFTEMLLKGLRGGGAHDIQDEWRISTTRLKEAIDLYLARAVAAGEKKKQVPPADDLTTFDFHFLKDERPLADVFVQCKPEDANNSAVLGCKPMENGISQATERTVLSAEPWPLQLLSGSYSFAASFADGSFKPNGKTSFIRPPLREIRIDVTQNG